MDRQVIVETAGASLYFHPAHGIVHHQIHRPIAGDEFRGLLVRGLEVMRQHHATKWLSDDRKNAPMTRDDGLWTQDVWLPEALAAGWKRWAMVLPESPAARRVIQIFTDWGAPLGLAVQLFSDPDDALAWLAAS